MQPTIHSSTTPLASTGQIIETWTLRGEGGLELEVISYGGIVTRLLAPDRRGNMADVVLGFADPRNYLATHPYFGAIVGRVAGRITGARFTLDGKIYELPANESPNHLHGGIHGFDKKIWTATPVSRPDGVPSLRLTYQSPDGEEGYPGTVDVAITYTVTADNAFVIETEATTDRPTPLCMTHHSYFNLAGEGSGTIENHELQLHSDSYAPTDGRLALLGRRDPVGGQGNDFNRSRRVGDALPHFFYSHGALYFLPRSDANKLSDKKPQRVARLFESISGRVLTVSTTEDCIQLYTGVYLDRSLIGKSGRSYGPFSGLCLECQGYPDGVHVPELGDIILRPGQILRQTTIYAFSTD